MHLLEIPRTEQTNQTNPMSLFAIKMIVRALKDCPTTKVQDAVLSALYWELA